MDGWVCVYAGVHAYLCVCVCVVLVGTVRPTSLSTVSKSLNVLRPVNQYGYLRARL